MKPVKDCFLTQPCIRRVVEQGYSIHFESKIDEEGLSSISFVVFLNGQMAGGGTFAEWPKCIVCQNIGIDDAHQRKGIANALYRIAELMTGKVMYNLWSDNTSEQSTAARHLWGSERRCFGENPPAE